MQGTITSLSLPRSEPLTWPGKAQAKIASLLFTWWPSVALGIGALLLAPIYFNQAYSFDEIWFHTIGLEASTKLANEGFYSFIATQENALGYGAIYWIVYGHLGYFFSDSLLAARFLALVSMLSVPACAIVYGWRTKSQFSWFAVLLWFTFPLCWWTGKISGPETFSMMLSTVGILLLLMHSARPALLAGATLLGLAIGIKLTMAPFAIFAAFVVWRRSDAPMRMLTVLGFGMLLGLILANPLLLFNSARFSKNIVSIAYMSPNSDISRPSLSYLGYLYTNSNWEWDGVFRGGFFNWGLGGLAFLLWGIFVWRTGVDRRILLGFAAMMCCSTMLFMTKSRYYGWYWFPIIALIPLITCEARASANRYLVTLAVAILIINAIYARPLIARGLEIKQNQRQAIKNSADLQQCVQKEIDKAQFRVSKVFWCVEPGVISDQSLLPIESKRRHVDSLTAWDAFQWFRNDRYESLKPGRAICVVFSRNLKRIDRKDRIVDFQKKSPEFDVRVKHASDADIFIVRRQKSANHEQLSQRSTLSKNGE
jgi:hypothetical protein